MQESNDEARTAELRQTLTTLRSNLLSDIHGRAREARADRLGEVVDQFDDSDANTREGLDHALLEMRANTLSAIDDAITRLDAGQYGFCFECEGPIAARRLRALPFAVRCRECEEAREQVPGRSRPNVERRAGLFIDPASRS